MRALRLLIPIVVGLSLSVTACHADDAANNLKAAQGFLVANGRQPGVITLPSGLEYSVVHSGPADGPHPGPTDEVKANYEGKFLDGKVFDSSFQRGEPLDLPIDHVIAAWTEGLQLMRPGDEWILYVPPALGYGARGAGGGVVPPNSLLIFRVQLISILPRPPEAG
jgi:peptidylprolyl isomerase/FKBP-type peptidyl-prolyl cis-trans isomerase FklB